MAKFGPILKSIVTWVAQIQNTFLLAFALISCLMIAYYRSMERKRAEELNEILDIAEKYESSTKSLRKSSEWFVFIALCGCATYMFSNAINLREYLQYLLHGMNSVNISFNNTVGPKNLSFDELKFNQRVMEKQLSNLRKTTASVLESLRELHVEQMRLKMGLPLMEDFEDQPTSEFGSEAEKSSSEQSIVAHFSATEIPLIST